MASSSGLFSSRFMARACRYSSRAQGRRAVPARVPGLRQPPPETQTKHKAQTQTQDPSPPHPPSQARKRTTPQTRQTKPVTALDGVAVIRAQFPYQRKSADEQGEKSQQPAESENEHRSEACEHSDDA
jgi:hypothetical protein